MPELPEVEAVVHALREDGLPGKRLRALHVLRAAAVSPQSPAEVETLTVGAKVLQVERRAKNILVGLSNRQTIRIHLRMTGDVRVEESAAESKPLRVYWDLGHGRRLAFYDPRALGRVHVHSTAAVESVLGRLGPEPLSDEFTPRLLAKLASASRLPAKIFLMDQTKIAGLGNIYAAEALYRARIGPKTPVDRLSTNRIRTLHSAIRETLQSAVHSIYKAYREPGGYRGHQDDFHRAVYGRKGENCFRCGHPILKETQGGRSTYYCGYCQR